MRLFIAICFFIPACILCQVPYTPAVYSYHGKNYFVYPVRMAEEESVPPTAFHLPDGDYIIFYEYEFKNKFLSRRTKLRDTTKISGFCTIQNGMCNGDASFFSYEYKVGFRNGHTEKRASEKTYGQYKSGFKEGAWISESFRNKSKIIKHYSEGLLNGELLEYNISGTLIRREKFRNERPCDTLYVYYPEGSLHFMFDVRDALYETDSASAPNFNYFLLHKVFDGFFPTGNLDHIKTFYKSFYRNGKVENNIHFNGHLQPEFDTLINYAGTRLVVKFDGIDKGDSLYRVYTFSEGDQRQSKTCRWYRGQHEYRYQLWYYNKKTKQTDSLETSNTPLQSINMQSHTPVLISSSSESGNKKKSVYMIPFCRYCWEEKSGTKILYKPVLTDSLSSDLIVRDTVEVYNTGLKKAKSISIETEKPLLKEPESEWKKFSFLPGLASFNPVSPSNAREYLPYFSPPCEQLSGRITEEKYLFNGMPAMGKFMIVPVKRKQETEVKTIQQLKSSGLISLCALYEFENGQKSGKQEELVMANRKKINSNFESIFFKEGKEGDKYLSRNFLNGKAEGNLREYTVYNTVVKSFNKDSTNFTISRKLLPSLSFEANYSDGKLNGPCLHYTSYNKLYYKCNFKNGFLEGAAESYWKDGRVRAKINFSNDKLSGTYEEFEGLKILSANFSNNKLCGTLSRYNLKGKLWQQIVADSNLMKQRILYFDGGEKKEELTFDTMSPQEFSGSWLSSENFLSLFASNRKEEGFAYFFTGSVKEYYENGQLLCKGNVVDGKPQGSWSFYNIAGVMTEEVYFKDTVIYYSSEPKLLHGKINAFYYNGSKRFTGYINTWQSSYNCDTRTDKAEFSVTYTNTWSADGKQDLKNENGYALVYTADGIKFCEGDLKQGREEGIWKYYDPAGRLFETGKFNAGKKEGLWYRGDLENINFEQGSCFDSGSDYARRLYEQNKLKIKLETEIYKNGILRNSEQFETDLNKN